MLILLTCAITVLGHKLNVREKTGNVHYVLKIRTFLVSKLSGGRATGSTRYGFQ